MLVNKTSIIKYLNDLQNIVICYVITFLLVIGVISNVVNLIISTRKKMLKSTIGYYYTFMSVFNILALITSWLILFPPAVDILPNLVLISGE